MTDWYDRWYIETVATSQDGCEVSTEITLLRKGCYPKVGEHGSLEIIQTIDEDENRYGLPRTEHKLVATIAAGQWAGFRREDAVWWETEGSASSGGSPECQDAREVPDIQPDERKVR